VLGLEQVGRNQNFFELGGDSILSIHIVARARRAGLSLSPMQMFQHQTIAGLAEAVGSRKQLQAPQGVVTGPVLLTPVQSRFFSQKRNRPHHYNQSLLLECLERVNPESVGRAIAELLTHHDALRMRFWMDSGQWRQAYLEKVEGDFLHWIDLSGIEREHRAPTIQRVAGELQASLNLDRGLVLRVGYFDCGPEEPQRLIFVAHHLVIDTVSWGIVGEDLEQVYGQLTRGQPLQLPAKTTSYQQWAEVLADYRHSEDLKQEADYWLKAARRPVSAFQRDYDEGDNTESSQAEVRVELNAVETERLVREVSRWYGGGLQEVLITALVQSVTEWNGDQGLLVELEGHGREEEIADVDLTRTVGWFTTIFPVWFDRAQRESLYQQVKRVREQLQAMAGHGIGYGVLRYLDSESPIAQELARAPRAEICFNYFGQFDAVLNQVRFFRPAAGAGGAEHDRDEHREYTFEINCWTSQGRFCVNWIYSRKLHRAETVERLAQDYVAALRRLLDHCATSFDDEIESEVDVLGIDPRKLDDILAEIHVKIP
jgi:non-ribosomal peptide synthase protein (TIGR01720 family)